MDVEMADIEMNGWWSSPETVYRACLFANIIVRVQKMREFDKRRNVTLCLNSYFRAHGSKLGRFTAAPLLNHYRTCKARH